MLKKISIYRQKIKSEAIHLKQDEWLLMILLPNSFIFPGQARFLLSFLAFFSALFSFRFFSGFFFSFFSTFFSFAMINDFAKGTKKPITTKI